MLIGKAAKWWEPTVRDFLTHASDRRKPETARLFSSYGNFEAKLKTTFGDPDEKRVAVRKMSGLRQTGSAAFYARDFTQLAAKLDWGSEPLMIQFYNGLNEGVKDELSREDPPDTLAEY